MPSPAKTVSKQGFTPSRNFSLYRSFYFLSTLQLLSCKVVPCERVSIHLPAAEILPRPVCCPRFPLFEKRARLQGTVIRAESWSMRQLMAVTSPNGNSLASQSCGQVQSERAQMAEWLPSTPSERSRPAADTRWFAPIGPLVGCQYPMFLSTINDINCLAWARRPNVKGGAR
jgi:hypothetical protein